jgi:hypothetical protein
MSGGDPAGQGIAIKLNLLWVNADSCGSKTVVFMQNPL